MFKHLTTLCGVLFLSTIAQAGAVIDLIPDNMGPYLGGETVNVTYMLSQDSGTDKYVRLLQFDMNASDPALALDSFRFDFMGVGCVGLPCLGGLQYARFVGLADADGAIVVAVYFGDVQSSFDQRTISADGSAVSVGHLELTLPTDVGIYTLDAVNPTAGEPMNQSARLHFGFGGADPIAQWTGINGLITGGTFTFEVIPEPTTLALFALGGLALLRRRTT